MIIHLASSIGVVAFALIYLFGEWEPAKDIYLPLMAVCLLCQAYMFRKTSKPVAVFALVVAIFITIVYPVGMFIK